MDKNHVEYNDFFKKNSICGITGGQNPPANDIFMNLASLLYFSRVTGRFERLISQTGWGDWGLVAAIRVYLLCGWIDWDASIAGRVTRVICMERRFWGSVGGSSGGWPIDHLGRTR
jgi:hypothetical protein